MRSYVGLVAMVSTSEFTRRLKSLQDEFELAAAHEREFVMEGVLVDARVHPALRAAVFCGISIGLEHALNLLSDISTE